MEHTEIKCMEMEALVGARSTSIREVQRFQSKGWN